MALEVQEGWRLEIRTTEAEKVVVMTMLDPSRRVNSPLT
jgi:hypothetical protein